MLAFIYTSDEQVLKLRLGLLQTVQTLQICKARLHRTQIKASGGKIWHSHNCSVYWIALVAYSKLALALLSIHVYALLSNRNELAISALFISILIRLILMASLFPVLKSWFRIPAPDGSIYLSIIPLSWSFIIKRKFFQKK